MPPSLKVGRRVVRVFVACAALWGLVAAATAAVEHLVFDAPVRVRALLAEPLLYLGIAVLRVWGLAVLLVLAGLLVLLALGGWRGYWAGLAVFLVQAAVVFAAGKHLVASGTNPWPALAVTAAAAILIFGIPALTLLALRRPARKSA
ncbi:MAG: hypothetical protein JXB04_11005 [Kiritimatiellae bacterium]|nr:hypothetical protein [Kiritimatiellia bacterium]